MRSLHRASPARVQAVVEALAGGPATVLDLVRATNDPSIRPLLASSAAEGWLVRLRRGVYALAPPRP